MREFVVWTANQRGTSGRWATLARLIRNWRHRRDLARLMAMDDHMLRDMGLSRDMLQHLRRLPLTVDHDWECERLQRLGRPYSDRK